VKKRYDISIVIPTYKNTKFLEECIKSAINSAKKCSNFEILLGIDNCYDTLKFISSNSWFLDKNIKVFFFSKNVGPYVIRNTLARFAKYDNILFFDSDDIMMEDMIETLLSKFNDKKILKFKFYNFENARGYHDIENLMLSPIFAHGVFLIKKYSFFDMRGFFPWRCGADTEFSERFEAVGNFTSKIDVPFFYRRYHDSNITKSPETSLESDERKKIKEIILEKRKNKSWNSPKHMSVSNCARIL
jgi:glycosyltransferase involved in cell wall biosynthesis